MNELLKSMAIVAFSATISIVVTIFVLDHRYRDALEVTSFDLPDKSMVEIKQELDNLPQLLVYNVLEKSYSVVSEIDDLEKSLIVFSDFNCVYCAKNHAKYDSFAISNDIASIYFIETPILGEESRQKALLAIDTYLLDTNGFDRGKYYGDLSNVVISESNKADVFLKKHEEVTSSLGINATPTYLVKGSFAHSL